MERKTTTPPLPLREQAEQFLGQEGTQAAASTPEQTLIHELQVHQIELRMQNEALRQAQVALEESRQRYSDLYHHAPVGYVILNRAGIIVESNATFAAMLAMDCAAIDGRAFADLLIDEDGGIFRARLRSFFKQPLEKHMELRLRLDHRRHLDIELSASALAETISSPQQIEQLFIAITDISSRKRLEMEQNALTARIKQLDKENSLSRLAGAVAHNFNNMLAVILGNLELALEMLPQGQLPLKELRDAQRAGMRAAETSSLILTYLGQNRTRKERLDLADICDHILPPLLQAKPGEVTISCHHRVDRLKVQGDEALLRQLVNNLMANALEALQGKPGEISLALSRVTASEIAKENRFPLDWQPQKDEYACLTIGDDGCGIEPEIIELIFDPFFTSKFPGRGMGLSVALGILRSHEGCVTVESGSRSGSTFRVYLPIAPPTDP